MVGCVILLSLTLYAITLRGERREGRSPKRISSRATTQRGSTGGASLSPLCFCSRDLMRDFAAMLLCWKR